MESMKAKGFACELKVEGMACAHCVKAIQAAVGALPGVIEVSVDLQTKTVIAVHDPAEISVDKIRQAIEEQGYDVME